MHLEAADVGPAAHDAMPRIVQLIVAAGDGMDEAAFARKLLVARKRFTNGLRPAATEPSLIYVCSLSPRVIVYKGMLTPSQLFPFYPDLTDPGYESHLAMVHSRFSTNTFPSGDRAQPNRIYEPQWRDQYASEAIRTGSLLAKVWLRPRSLGTI